MKNFPPSTYTWKPALPVRMIIPPDINSSQNDNVIPSAQLYGETKQGSFRVSELKKVVQSY